MREADVLYLGCVATPDRSEQECVQRVLGRRERKSS